MSQHFVDLWKLPQLDVDNESIFRRLQNFYGRPENDPNYTSMMSQYSVNCKIKQQDIEATQSRLQIDSPQKHIPVSYYS